MEENRRLIGVHKNQHGSIAACKILAVHDVLNRVFYHVHLHPRAITELVALHQNFEVLPKDPIMIYDRHYCDSLLLDRHIKSKKPCLIRMKIKGIKVVDEFLKSGFKDLYAKRWGVETAFDELKKQLKLGVFSIGHNMYYKIYGRYWSFIIYPQCFFM